MSWFISSCKSVFSPVHRSLISQLMFLLDSLVSWVSEHTIFWDNRLSDPLAWNVEVNYCLQAVITWFYFIEKKQGNIKTGHVYKTVIPSLTFLANSIDLININYAWFEFSCILEKCSDPWCTQTTYKIEINLILQCFRSNDESDVIKTMASQVFGYMNN